jgi:hypothetical protein
MRSKLVVQKARNTSDKLENHERRRLRAKIATVLIEVRKRQGLHQLQEKQKKFRERRHAAGRGPAASLGDTTEFALGLTCLSESATKQDMTSPRRTALLDSLTLEEFATLRQEPSFFFTGNAIAAALPQHAEQNEQTSIGDRSSGSGDAGKVPTSLYRSAVDSSVFEDLIEFFACTAEDKLLDISVYVKNLRAQLLSDAGRQNHGAGSGDVDWRKRLCREQEAPVEEPPAIDYSVPKGPLEMMPCLGRHPPIRADQESPTLLRVRDVYQRRDEQDARWVDERRDKIGHRLALNAFKAKEQQRELLLQDFKQKELHKVRMLQAEEKKAVIDFEAQERTEVMSIQKIHRLRLANERVEEMKEEHRERVTDALDSWQEGVQRAKQLARKTEWEKRKEGERNLVKYMTRLEAMGESRHHIVKSQVQKNDDLKRQIQTSFSWQLKEQDAEARLAKAEANAARHEAAALRRSYSQLGNRYCLVEKAFGANSVGFDAKHHSISVDRRCNSWQKNAEAWAKTKGSFSAPVLPPARPLSPGGTFDEDTFKTISPSKNSGLQMSSSSKAGFTTDTSAVALV